MFSCDSWWQHNGEELKARRLLREELTIEDWAGPHNDILAETTSPTMHLVLKFLQEVDPASTKHFKSIKCPIVVKISCV